MLKIAICDDEDLIIKKMYEIVTSYFHEKNEGILVKIYHSGNELLSENLKFDIIFLDIEMPGLDGFETANILRKNDKNLKIIYLTNFSYYHRMAFKVHAFDYLEKPVSKEKIEHVLDEVLEYLRIDNSSTELYLKLNGGAGKIKISDIYYLEYCARELKIVLKDTVCRSSAYTLKEMYEKVKSYDFEFSHKSFVVNLTHVKYIKNSEIYMDNDLIIPIAQKKAVGFKKSFNDYLQKTFDRN